MSDIDNKAIQKAIAIPPALLDEIAAGNEDALSGAARVQLAFIMERMTYKAVAEGTSLSATTGLMEVLRKIAAKESAAGNKSAGPQVVINITRRKDRNDSVTIEGQAKEINPLPEPA